MTNKCTNSNNLYHLNQFQRWFLDAIQRAHRTEQPDSPLIPVDAPLISADHYILPSKTLSAQARLDIYSDMYFLRLRDVLQSNFRGLYALLGHANFSDMARDFLTHHPSQSFTLNALGQPLPSYFLSPPGCKKWGSRAQILCDLATLEQAVDRCFRAPLTPTLEAAALAQIPDNAWSDIKFEMSAGFSVMSFQYNVNSALNEQKLGKPISDRVWEQDASWVAIWRRDFVVWRQSLSEPMFEILKALAEGQNMSAALRTAAAVWTDTEEALERKLFAWFADWVGEGFFAAVVLPHTTA